MHIDRYFEPQSSDVLIIGSDRSDWRNTHSSTGKVLLGSQ
jgi:hypothetical protein